MRPEAATDADHLVPAVEPEPHERLRRRVHAGSDATAVQDADAAASGLSVENAFSTWDLRPFGPDATFLVAFLTRA